MAKKRIERPRKLLDIPDPYHISDEDTKVLEGYLKERVIAENQQLIGVVLVAVRTGEEASYAPFSFLHKVYESAWKAYRSGVAEGKSEKDSRNAALGCIWSLLATHFDIPEGTSFSLRPVTDDHLEALVAHWSKRSSAVVTHLGCALIPALPGLGPRRRYYSM